MTAGPNPPQGPEATDHLATYGKPVAIGLALVAVGLTVVSFTTGISEGLPAIALNWRLGLDAIRAAEIFAIVAVVVMVIVRGWGGMWPTRVSTSGIDFAGVAEGSKEISYAVSSVLEVLPEMVRLEVESANKQAESGSQ